MSEEKSKSRFELRVELMKALVWPVFALIILLTFWTPLRDAAKELPKLMREAESVSIYQFSVKVKKQLQQRETPEVGKVLASPDVERVLARLSSDGIKNLLNAQFVTCWKRGVDNIPEYEELFRLGLLEEVTDMNRCPNDRKLTSDYAFGPTNLGKATQQFILAFIAQSAQELARPEPARD